MSLSSMNMFKFPKEIQTKRVNVGSVPRRNIRNLTSGDDGNVH